MNDSRRGPTIILRIALVFAGVALGPLRSVDAQEPQSWRSVAKAADEAYFRAIDVAAYRQRLADQAAADAWVRGYEEEFAKARRAGDAALLGQLGKTLAEARESGKAPPKRPTDAIVFGAHTYWLLPGKLDWHIAKGQCEELGGHIVTIESEAEERFLVEQWGSLDFGIGAESLSLPGTYLQLDGSPFKAFAYKVVVDNFGKRERIMAWSSRDRRWNDHDEGARRPFICEWD